MQRGGVLKYLLDTCVISELTKKAPRNSVVDFVASVDEAFLYLSVLTLGEIRKGIAKLADSDRRAALLSWLKKDVCQRFEGRIIPISVEIAETWGEIQGAAERNGVQLPAIDGLIAATAIAHDLTVVTRNAADMQNSGVTICNPWL